MSICIRNDSIGHSHAFGKYKEIVFPKMAEVFRLRECLLELLVVIVTHSETNLVVSPAVMGSSCTDSIAGSF